MRARGAIAPLRPAPADLGIASFYRKQLAVHQIRRRLSIEASAYGSGAELASSGPMQPSPPFPCPGSTAAVEALLGAVELKTIDKFQGRDKACLLVSVVASNARGEVSESFL